MFPPSSAIENVRRVRASGTAAAGCVSVTVGCGALWIDRTRHWVARSFDRSSRYGMRVIADHQIAIAVEYARLEASACR